MRLKKTSLIAFAEYMFVIVAILLISDALTPILYPEARESQDPGDSNPHRLILATTIYSIALALLIPRIKVALSLLKRRPELILLLALPIVSAVWSAEPEAVAKRAFAHFLTVTFCFYVATRYSPEDFFERLLVAFTIGIVASIFVAIALPDIGIAHDEANGGAWQGFYGHKAIAGRMCAFTLFLSFLYKAQTRSFALLRLTAILCSILLCTMTQSRASWLLILFGFGAMAIVQCLRFSRLSAGIRIATAGSIVIMLIALGIVSFNELLSSVGRDATFSGRTKLWDAAITVASDHHPWLGSGYRDFWLGPAAQDVARYLATWAKVPGHGHNGYLDTWLELGWVGIAILLFFIVRTLFSVCGRAIKEPASNIWAAFAVFCMIFIVNNMSATVALRHTDVTWVLVIVANLYAAKVYATAPRSHAKIKVTSDENGRYLGAVVRAAHK